MTKVNKLVLAAASTVALGATSDALAFFGSSQQGPRLTGIALESLETHRPVAATVTLPSGQTFELRGPATPPVDAAAALPSSEAVGPHRQAAR